jgi:hypothetical protein
VEKKKRKRIVKPKEDKQTVDGLNMTFEQAMQALSNPKRNPKPKQDK